jgi:hypothetical protein
LERDTSTTLSIKAAKANIATRIAHSSARFTVFSPYDDGRIAADFGMTGQKLFDNAQLV